MRSLGVVALLGCLVVASSMPERRWVHVCTQKECSLPDCQCSEIEWKGTPIANKPQFVVLSFDDSVSEESYLRFIKPTFVNKRNSDGCPIGATFFVPHEYTNYSIVNKLYGHDFEIASHSITKNFSTEYWRTASAALLTSEFAGQRTIISTFSGINESEIQGVRVPQLEINGNTFRALKGSNFSYDASWPSQQPWSFYPYSLDYTSRQRCHTQECQVEPTPGLWEMPIIDWVNEEGISCNSVQACAVENNIVQWMVKNFNTAKKSGAPFALRLSYSWFSSKQAHVDALNEFIRYLLNQHDTYIVSYRFLLEWSKNPTEEFSTCIEQTSSPCTSTNCRFKEPNGLERWVGVCGACPPQYPWLDNPLGQNY